MAKIETLKMPRASEDVDSADLSYMDNGDRKWYRRFRNQSGGFL